MNRWGSTSFADPPGFLIPDTGREGDAVVMSLDHYSSSMETLHLTSHPANAAALARAIAQDQAGQAQEQPLLPAD